MRRIFLSFATGLALLAGPVLALPRPLAFEENRGQTDARVRFLARGDGYALFLTPAEAVLVPRSGGPPLHLKWLGARPVTALSGEGGLPGRTHYLVGPDPAGWRTGIPSWTQVRYQGVWPGIDLVFYGNPRQLEYDFVVAPGADPGAIRLAVEGADRPEIDAAGDLVLRTGGEEVRLRGPVAFQEVAGVRRAVASGWRLAEGVAGFELGAYDPARPLVIDPVLVWSSYLGGSREDQGNAIAVSPAGDVYVTGYTSSPDFPPGPGAKPGKAYVTRVDRWGRLVSTTFVGGSGFAAGLDIAVDPAGAIYVVGTSEGPDFPRVNAPPTIPSPHGDPLDGFLFKLDRSASVLLYSTNLGGAGPDTAFGVAVDRAGHAWVVGSTRSADFPTVHPVQPCGPADAFVTKFHRSGSSLLASTCLGGSADDVATGVDLDAAGHAWVGGSTSSANFPTVRAFQAAPGGGRDAFLAKLDRSGSTLLVSTYAGGSGDDHGLKVAVDHRGRAHLAGTTQSADFPLLHPWQATLRGQDALLLGVASSGALVYATFFGGSGLDLAQDLVVDGPGRISLTGTTTSDDLPLKEPLQRCEPTAASPFCADAFVTTFAPEASSLLFSTYLGGQTGGETPDAAEDEGFGIAVDPAGALYVTGLTVTVDFPTVRAFQPENGRGPSFFDGFVAKIEPRNLGKGPRKLRPAAGRFRASPGSFRGLRGTFRARP